MGMRNPQEEPIPPCPLCGKEVEDCFCTPYDFDRNIKDYSEFLEYLEADSRESAKKTVYDDTACGAWLEFYLNGISLGSIVEGSNGEVGPYYLNYPFTKDEFQNTLDSIEIEVSQIINEEEEECDD